MQTTTRNSNNPSDKYRLLFTMLAAPVAWFVQLLLNWGLTEGACAENYQGFLSVGAIRAVIVVAGVVGVIISIAAGVTAWRGRPQSENDPDDPKRFIALGGVFLATFFTLAIIFTALPVFVLPCD
jgi:fumarate reductase subunit C